MNNYTKQMLEDYRVLTQHVIETTNDDNLKMLAENTLELHEGFDFGEMGKVDAGLSEAIEKTTNAMNVIELYQGIINWSSVAPEKSGSPKYYIGLLEKNLDTMYSMNQKLHRDLDEVAFSLQELENILNEGAN